VPQTPYKSVTSVDFPALAKQVRELTLVLHEAQRYTDEDSQRHAVFLGGAIAALTWMQGGPVGSELYSAQLEGEKLARLEAMGEVSR
jgi:hypothetical protein